MMMPEDVKAQEEAGEELVPDWSGVPINDEREPEGDPHEEGEGS
jgi:hypothetical protein